MTREAKKLLLDVQEAAASILERTAGCSLAQYTVDRWFRRAVEREFEVIGEALNRLSRADPSVAGQITGLRQIVDFRNRISHGYDTVDDEVIWGVIEKHLPVLKREVDELMGTLED